MDGIFRIKKLLALFLFLVPIHGARCKSDSTKKVQDDESTELSWKIGDFYSFRDIQLVNNTLRTITVSDCFDCVAACLAEPHCCSVNFKLADDLSICNLNRRCRRETVEDGCLMKTERSVYFELSDTKGRSSDGDACESSPCLNGGSCVLTDPCNGYKCVCYTENTGEHCEYWIDDAGDFDLEVNHGISNSDFASFNFATSGFSPEKRWDAFTACFWFKVFMDTSAVYSLLAFYSNEELLFKLKYKEATGRLSFKGYANESLLQIRTKILKDTSWHHICAGWENKAGIAEIFIDGIRNIRSYGSLIGFTFSRDALVILDKQGSTSSRSYLTCLRMWPSVIEDEEVRRAFEDKKCSNNSSTPFIWPLFKRAELRGGALWTNSSSLLKEDLDFDVHFEQGSYISMESFQITVLTSLTVCLWENSITDHQSGQMSFLSYTTPTDSSAFVMDIGESSGILRLTATINGVVGRTAYSKFSPKNGVWNHLCLVWKNIPGTYSFFINGTEAISGILVGHQGPYLSYLSIPADGLLVIGGKKTAAHMENPFVGRMTCLQMWSFSLTDTIIKALSQKKRCEKYSNPLLNWNEVKSGIAVGNVRQEVPSSVTQPNVVSEEDFDVQFAPESTGSYVMKETITGLQLSSLTVSMWLKNDKCDSKHTSFVYSTTDYDSEISFKLEGITAIQECKLSIIMKNYELGSKYIGLDSSRWHFVAFAWRSKDGNYVFVVNSFSELGLGKFEGKTIESGNILIGQQSENVNLENPFSGRITCFQMLKTFLSKEQIEEIYKGNGAKDGKCQTNDDSYRFLTWAQVKTANTKGEVTFHWPSELI